MNRHSHLCLSGAHAARGLLLGALLGCAALSGCTRESVRLAISAQRRADEVQRSVFEHQHAALRVLLYRDLAVRLAQDAAPLNDVQRAALSATWNDRDLAEFWALQYERAASLRTATVDAALASQQSIIDLLWKQLTARGDRVAEGIAAEVGAGLQAAAPAGDGVPAPSDAAAP